MSEQSKQQEMVEKVWRSYLNTGDVVGLPPYARFMYHSSKKIFRVLPANPRCELCYSPFEGVGGRLVSALFGRKRSRMNPLMCNVCEQFAEKHQGGAEVELSMLFVDVRGSTSLAEGMSALQFSQLISRFYKEASNLMIDHRALVGQLIGDQVAGYYTPGLAGPMHAMQALETARAILQATGNSASGEPWIPVGIGVHTGVAFVGAVGSNTGVTTITALGDAVNTTARLSSQAGMGEILVSEAAALAAPLETTGLESRELSLKGRTEPVKVYAMRLPAS